jgi:hypothetical protein
MAYTIIQSGATLQFLDTSGNLTNLTLPAGATLRTDVPPRWAIFGNFAILVNTPNFPLTIDATGTVRPLTPKPPAVAPTLSAGAAGTLTGTYGGVRYTYIIKDAIGNIISESDFSPPSNTVTIANQRLAVSGVTTSADPISARRLYRTTSNGAILFPWFDIDGNTVTSASDDLSDAALSLVAAPDFLGTPPLLTLIKEWRNLLWGVGDASRDTLQASAPGAMYAWNSDNTIPIPGTGRDEFGIRSLMPRREALGVGRRDIIWQVTGTTFDDFRTVKLSENTGIESNESMVIYRDTVWWLWKDGVYQWDDNGIKNIAELGGVKSWFTTNSYFNRDVFPFSFAVFDPVRLKYRLYLAGAGSNVIDHWVEYDVENKTWWGPHKTAAFAPTCAFILSDEDDKIQAIAGSQDAFVWEEQDTATDGTSSGIAIDVDTRFFDGGIAEFEKYFGELSIVGKVQSAGTIQITPKTGYLDAPVQTSIPYDMTSGRQRLRRIGHGKLAQLNLQHSTAGEPVELYGMILPYHILGRR